MNPGDEIEFLETEDGIVLVLVIKLSELIMEDEEHKEKTYQLIREMEEERRKETRQSEEVA